MKPGRYGTPAEILEQVAAEQGETLAGLSRFVGRRDAYLQAFVREGVPDALPAEVRKRLAKYLGVEERRLGAIDDAAARGTSDCGG